MASKKRRKKNQKLNRRKQRMNFVHAQEIRETKIVRTIPIEDDKMVPQNNKTAIKQYFYARYGHRCWLCGKEFEMTELTLHHIIPFHITRHTVLSESSIACTHCHFKVINKVPYNTQEYWELMEKMFDNIKKWEKERQDEQQN